MRVLRWIAAAFASLCWAGADFLWRHDVRSNDNWHRTFPTPVLPEVHHVGATEDWWIDLRLTNEDMASSETRELVLDKEAPAGNRLRWLDDTGEYPVVLVSLDKMPEPVEMDGVVYGEVETERTTLVDELGEWDPSTADWSAPALLFEATAVERMGSWGALIPGDERPGILASLAEYALLCELQQAMNQG